jgi:hypothetical protein
MVPFAITKGLASPQSAGGQVLGQLAAKRFAMLCVLAEIIVSGCDNADYGAGMQYR